MLKDDDFANFSNYIIRECIHYGSASGTGSSFQLKFFECVKRFYICLRLQLQISAYLISIFTGYWVLNRLFRTRPENKFAPFSKITLKLIIDKIKWSSFLCRAINSSNFRCRSQLEDINIYFLFDNRKTSTIYVSILSE